ncbi:MAG: hypothetical protein IPJ48_05175 [Propionivibrio sp.]|uniref:Uncharacterized protein n=1 Tax=Candidatus Propionivibrio dominans TaxID=2954373 RepID=A0A9D7IH05_9RHOO|nr:hypothetical protein [Candidatus Propionivibrio dominans]
MPITIDPELREDLNQFLVRYQIENVAETPVSVFAAMEFPRLDKISEHQALSELVSRLLKLERLLSRHTRSLGRLDEQDLVRAAVDDDLTWQDSIGRPALVKLGLLDCRERLGRLVCLANEASALHAIDRLNSPSAGSHYRVLERCLRWLLGFTQNFPESVN